MPSDPTGSNVGQLNVQVQLTPQNPVLLPTTPANTTTSASAGTTNTGTISIVTITPVTFVANQFTYDNMWHTMQVPGIPSSAKWLYVGGYYTNQGLPDNQRQKFFVRVNSQIGTQYLLSYSNGVSGNYEDDGPIVPCLIPVKGAQFDYLWTNSITDFNLVVYGYSL